MNFVDDASSTSSDTLVVVSEPAEEEGEEEDDLEELRKKFVGEIDLPESTSLGSLLGLTLIIACRRGASAQRL